MITLRAPAEGRVLIRGASFMMGSEAREIDLAIELCRYEPSGDDCPRLSDNFAMEYPPHQVTLSDFFLDKLEVSSGDYDRCAEVGPCASRPLASGGKRFEAPEVPATMVTWSDAATYCGWRGGRLPTEAEWERAARGLAGRRYPWGNIYDPYLTNGGRFALDPFEDKDGYLELASVGSFPSGRTPDGILDLAGNAEEWVFDWYGAYGESGAVNPKGPDAGDHRVVRGGGYPDGRAWLRGAARGHDLPGQRRAWRGFRCAYDP